MSAGDGDDARQRASLDQDAVAVEALRILREHVDLVATGHALDETLAQLAASACRLTDTPADLGLVRVYDPVAHLRRQDVRGNGHIRRSAPPMTAQEGIIGRALRTQETQRVADVHQDAHYVAFRQDVRSELAVPLNAGDLCWGVLNIESTEPDHFRASIVPAIEMLAAQAALTIQHALLQQQTNRLQVAEMLGTSLTELQTVSKFVTDEACQALTKLGVDRVSVEVAALTPDRETLVSLAFATANAHAWQPDSYSKGATIAWEAVGIGQSVEYRDLIDSNRRTRVGDTLCATVLPVLSASGVVKGVISFETPRAHGLDGYERYLPAFVSRAALALVESARPAAQLLAAIVRDIGQRITQMTDPSDVTIIIQKVLRDACEMLSVRGSKAAVGLLREQQLTVLPEHTYNYTATMKRTWSWPVEEEPTGWAVTRRQPVLIDDVHFLSPENYIELDPDADCELVVPLVHGDEVLGVIDVIAPGVGSLTRHHQYLLEALAGLVVQALDRAAELVRRDEAKQRIDLLRQTNERGIEDMLRATNARTIREARDAVLRQLIAGAVQHTGSQYGAVMGVVHVPGKRRSRVGSVAVARAGEESVEMIPLAAHPEHAQADPERSYAVTQGIIGEVYAARGPRTEGDLLLRPELVCWQNPRVRSELVVPLLSGDRVLGVLDLQSINPWLYSPEQIEEVELLASQAASIISAADLRIQGVQLEQFIRLEREIVTESLFDEGEQISRGMKPRILNGALQLTDQLDGHASIWLASSGHLTLDSYLSQDPTEFATSVPSQAHPGIANLVYETQRPILALDLESPEWKKVFARNWLPACSQLAVPLVDPARFEGQPARVIGVLNVESRRPYDFSDRDVEFLSLLAQATVAALRGRQLYQGRINLLRDITHAVSKIAYPLAQAVQGLRRQPTDPGQPQFSLDRYQELAGDIVTLTDMVNSLFGWFSQLVSYEDHVRPAAMEETPVGALIHDIAARMRPFAEERGKTVMAAPLPDKCSVSCAVKLIKAALFLLIDNALAYGPPDDTVIVRAQRARQAVRIEVIDHGVPVPQNERDLLFEPGFRGSTASGFGSGIGLDHVRRIVERAHRGHAGYKPIAGGNVFFIELSLAPRAKQAAGTVKAVSAHAL